MFDLPPHSLYVMAAVLGLLLVATGIWLWIQHQNPSHNYIELRQRIQSWWWMVGILFAVLTVSQGMAITFFAFVSFLALKEFLSIVPTRQADRRVIFWAYISIPVQYYWVSLGWYGMFIIFIPIYIFLLLPARMVLLGESKGFIRSAGILHWATMLSVYSISHIAYLLVLPVQNEAAGAIGLILFLLCITQLNDVFQYIWGKLLGRHKITPKVSPNKTWEGFIGGLFTITLCAGIVAPWLTPLNTIQGLLAGLLIGVSGFIGDLVISLVKRDLQIKDSGQLIPGHGGLLDRIDSLTYSSPLFFHFLYYTCY